MRSKIEALRAAGRLSPEAERQLAGEGKGLPRLRREAEPAEAIRRVFVDGEGRFLGETTRAREEPPAAGIEIEGRPPEHGAQIWDFSAKSWRRLPAGFDDGSIRRDIKAVAAVLLYVLAEGQDGSAAKLAELRPEIHRLRIIIARES